MAEPVPGLGDWLRAGGELADVAFPACNIPEVLTPAERALFTRRRKEIYEALHPETRHGGDRKSSRQNGDLNDAERFTADTAARTGHSERAVQRDASRGSRIDEEVLSTIAGTDFDMGHAARAPIWTPL